MARNTIVTAGLVVLSAQLVSGQGEPKPNEQPRMGPPVSVERIRAGLERPARQWLAPEVDTAHFRTEVVEEPWPLEMVLDAVRRELGADVTVKRTITAGSTRPLLSVDLLQIAMQVKDTLNATRRARRERNARRAVRAALAESCETRDCSTSDDPAASPVEGVLYQVQ